MVEQAYEDLPGLENWLRYDKDKDVQWFGMVRREVRYGYEYSGDVDILCGGSATKG